MDETTNEGQQYMHHGIVNEPVLFKIFKDELLPLLSGYAEDCTVEESGLWVTPEGSFPMLGASPDGKILGKNNELLGLVEFKCPVSRMYHSIPPKYLVQMQGQMALTGTKWCYFLAVCFKTQEIMFKKVAFSTSVWAAIKRRLTIFGLSKAQLQQDPKHFGIAIKRLKNLKSLDTRTVVVEDMEDFALLISLPNAVK